MLHLARRPCERRDPYHRRFDRRCRRPAWPNGRGVWVPAFAGTTAEPVQRAFISPRSNSPRITPHCRDEGDVMERRHFLKLAFGFAAGAAALAAGAEAEAAPLAPQPLTEGRPPPGNGDAQPAVATGDEVDRLAPEQVRWGRGRGHTGMGQAGLGLAPPRLGLAPSSHWGWHRRRRRLASPLLAPPSTGKAHIDPAAGGRDFRPPVAR